MSGPFPVEGSTVGDLWDPIGGIGPVHPDILYPEREPLRITITEGNDRTWLYALMLSIGFFVLSKAAET